jgi:hypothetical protein
MIKKVSARVYLFNEGSARGEIEACEAMRAPAGS